MKNILLISCCLAMAVFSGCGGNSYGLFDKSGENDTLEPIASLYISLADVDANGNAIYYYTQQETVLSSDVDQVQVKYTLDGSDPLTSATAQTGNLPVALDLPVNNDPSAVEVVLKAYTLAEGRQDGEVMTKTYQFPKIVFVSDKEGSKDIYIMSPDGNSTRQLTTDRTYNEDSPSFSPGNKQIIYRSNQSGDYDIYTMNVDGSNPTLLYNTTDDVKTPSLSPDGNLLLYSGLNGADYDPAIKGLNDTTHSFIEIDSYDNYFCQWSPNGTKIIMAAYNGINSAIYVYNILLSMTNLLTQVNPNVNSLEPQFSPDGVYYAFASNMGNPGSDNSEIYVGKTDGSKFTIGTTESAFVQLTNNSIKDGHPTWSPEAKKMVIASKATNSVLIIMDVDLSGTLPAMPNRQVLTSDAYNSQEPRFSHMAQ